MLSWKILLYAHMHVDTLISMRQIKMDYVIYPMLKYGGGNEFTNCKLLKKIYKKNDINKKNLLKYI